MTFMPYSVTLMLMQIITMYTEALDAFNNYNPKYLMTEATLRIFMKIYIFLKTSNVVSKNLFDVPSIMTSVLF